MKTENTLKRLGRGTAGNTLKMHALEQRGQSCRVVGTAGRMTDVTGREFGK